MWLRDLWGTFRTISFANVLDMLVIACLLYLVLLWFKRTKAAFVARGIFIFAAVYLVAQQAGMYLTTWMFQGFFAIFLIALVVIFQEELRSFFERLAIWSLRRRSSHPLQPKQVEILVRTAGTFAREHIGSLIVLRGRDPLERHIEGGEDLDGKLSEQLLASIFDTHSEGHDGAVVVEGDRVTHFGVHLPLSKDFAQLSGLGTRHAAALGLVERTDALCLVVSEERGAVSLAKDGYLFTVKNLKTLEEHIAAFLRDKAPATAEMRWWRDALRRNAMEKAVSVTIALGLWLVFVQGYSPASEVFKVPVEPRAVPEGLRVGAVTPANVNVTLKGLKRDLKLLNPLSLRVSLDLAEAKEGAQRVMVSEANLRVPGALQLAQVDPPAIELELVEAKKESAPLLRFLGLESSKPTEPTPPTGQPTPAPKPN